MHRLVNVCYSSNGIIKSDLYGAYLQTLVYFGSQTSHPSPSWYWCFHAQDYRWQEIFVLGVDRLNMLHHQKTCSVEMNIIFLLFLSSCCEEMEFQGHRYRNPSSHEFTPETCTRQDWGGGILVPIKGPKMKSKFCSSLKKM